MAKTEKEKRSRIKKVEELSDWMILMPDSAKKTLIPQLAPLHRYLLKKSLLYYRWHLNPYAQLAHWLSLFGSIFLVFIIIFTSIPLPVKAEAKVWDGGGPLDDWSDPLNWLPDGAPAAGDSVTFNDSGADENVNIDILGAWGSAGETITITGDAGATDGYDGTITQNVAIPGMGAFVESINGQRNTNGFYWILYVNGTSSPTGASQTLVHANDSLEWRYEKGY